MLLTLWRAGYVTLEPEPPKEDDGVTGCQGDGVKDAGLAATGFTHSLTPSPFHAVTPSSPPPPPPYMPRLATPTPQLQSLRLFRGVNPLYGMYLVNQLGIANRQERIQAMESVLDLPRSIGHFVRVPGHDQMPPGPLATTRVDPRSSASGWRRPTS